LISRWSAEAISTGWTSALKARANAPLTSRSRESCHGDATLGSRHLHVAVEIVVEDEGGLHPCKMP